MSGQFEHPYAVGLIGQFTAENRAISRKFNALFKRSRSNFTYLILKTDPACLKNLVLCMKLMDIVGINVSKKYQKMVMPHLDGLDVSAKKAMKVNTVARKGKKFIGYFVKDIFIDSVRLWRD
ncbi:MAG: hypothetical protein HYT75_07805 [Deltaproteobacteria bacterium]|nr:hypothetical protein [Deltaproteobacteria bacterium]